MEVDCEKYRSPHKCILPVPGFFIFVAAIVLTQQAVSVTEGVMNTTNWEPTTSTYQRSSKSQDYDPYDGAPFLLQEQLLHKYRRHVRPVLHSRDTIFVNVTSSLYQIVHMDQIRNLIKISAYFELSWDDVFLRWDPSDFEGITQIYLPSYLIWIPEIYLYYSIDETDGGILIQSGLDADVQYTGRVRYFLPFTANTLCPINVKYFPFDKQNCSLIFGAWSHIDAATTFIARDATVNLNDFFDNQEWILQRCFLGNHSFRYETVRGAEFYSTVLLSLEIERQDFYYVFNLVLPSALITVVALIGFHFPTASTGGRGSKFRLGIMTLLSMAVLLLSVVTDMPKFSSHAIEGQRGSFSSVPLIGIYYFTLLALTGLGTVTSSCFVVIERHVYKYEPAVPSWLVWAVTMPTPLDLFKSTPRPKAAAYKKCSQVESNHVNAVNHKSRRRSLDTTRGKGLPDSLSDINITPATTNHRNTYDSLGYTVAFGEGVNLSPKRRKKSDFRSLFKNDNVALTTTFVNNVAVTEDFQLHEADQHLNSALNLPRQNRHGLEPVLQCGSSEQTNRHSKNEVRNNDDDNNNNDIDSFSKDATVETNCSNSNKNYKNPTKNTTATTHKYPEVSCNHIEMPKYSNSDEFSPATTSELHHPQTKDPNLFLTSLSDSQSFWNNFPTTAPLAATEADTQYLGSPTSQGSKNTIGNTDSPARGCAKPNRVQIAQNNDGGVRPNSVVKDAFANALFRLSDEIRFLSVMIGSGARAGPRYSQHQTAPTLWGQQEPPNVRDWLILIQRMEVICLILYLLVICMVLWLFFHHSWY